MIASFVELPTQSGVSQGPVHRATVELEQCVTGGLSLATSPIGQWGAAKYGQLLVATAMAARASTSLG